MIRRKGTTERGGLNLRETGNEAREEMSTGFFLNTPRRSDRPDSFPIPTAAIVAACSNPHSFNSWSRRQIIRQLWRCQQPVSSTSRTCGCR